MRLIDADALMKEFAKFVRASNNSDFEPTPTWNDAVSLTGSAPTVSPDMAQVLAYECGKDSVEVVRCKDCKWWEKKSLGGSCELNIRMISNENFFCADGERKEDGDNR